MGYLKEKDKVEVGSWALLKSDEKRFHSYPSSFIPQSAGPVNVGASRNKKRIIGQADTLLCEIAGVVGQAGEFKFLSGARMALDSAGSLDIGARLASSACTDQELVVLELLSLRGDTLSPSHFGDAGEQAYALNCPPKHAAPKPKQSQPKSDSKTSSTPRRQPSVPRDSMIPVLMPPPPSPLLELVSVILCSTGFFDNVLSEGKSKTEKGIVREGERNGSCGWAREILMTTETYKPHAHKYPHTHSHTHTVTTQRCPPNRLDR